MEPLTPERRRQQTREHLLEAAAQVFAERGFDGASLDQVAAVAGFTKGAVYSNFENKEGLFLALLEARYENDMAALQRTLGASGDHPEEHLSEFVGLLHGQFEGQRWSSWDALFLEFCVYALRHESARQRLASFVRADVDAVAAIIEDERERHGEPALEPAEHVAVIVASLMRGISVMRAIDPEFGDRALLDSAISFIARAMTTEMTGTDS